jgi:hypothetical protein
MSKRQDGQTSTNKAVPVQDFPSPVNPAAQAQLLEPGKFVHTPHSLWQPPFFSRHSLISEHNTKSTNKNTKSKEQSLRTLVLAASAAAQHKSSPASYWTNQSIKQAINQRAGPEHPVLPLPE